MKRWARLPVGLLKAAKLQLQERFVTIPTDLITNEYAFSFADSGWHYFRALLAHYEKNPHCRLQDSTFFQFFQHKRIRSVRYLNDVLFFHDAVKRAQSNAYNFYFGTYPWGEWSLCDDATGGDPWGHYYDRHDRAMTRDLDGYRRNPWYQPGDAYPLKIEWRQTIRVYDSLKRAYRPVWNGSYPEVVLLVRQDGDMRAVVSEGQHRVASLSHLGHKRLRVMITRDSMRTIHENDVEQWYYVRHKLCTKQQAMLIFNAFFELNGRERLRYLGLASAY